MSNVFLSGQLVCGDKDQAAVVAQFLPLHLAARAPDTPLLIKALTRIRALDPP